ncbi:unnamed protein product, partial [Brassica oleracea]
IHNNSLQRSTLVRIPSEFLRRKILDKNIWYVGDSMFHTAQWSSEHSSSTPPLSSIKIWAHLTRVLLDLRYQHGFSLVAGLIGEPKETDDFTLNLVNLILSHVKVEVDLTKPLPSVVEFVRQSGEVVEVLVSYPWLPPKCTHCHELGHVVRNCLTYIPPKAPPASSASQKPMKKPVVNMQFVAVKTKVTKASSSSPSNTPVRSPKTVSLPTSPLVPTSLNLDSFTATKTFHPSTESPSDKPQKPSLKRSRSSLTFSPPSHPKVTYQSSNTIQMSLFPEDPAKVTLLAQSRQMIKCEVELPNYPLFTYSAIYASNLSEERADLWVELLNTQATLSLDSKPWMIGGDFNQILHSHEHSTFCHSVHSSRMFEFRDILLQLGVNDLRYYGPVHTRTNNRDIAHVAKKLDRCLINSQILTAFPNATSTFLPPAPSDHTPCLTDLACQLPIVGTQTFRFLNYLTKHPSFLE